MLIEKLLNGFIIGILVSIPLGPIGVLIVQRTVNKSQQSGYFSGMGAALSDAVYAIIAGFSLSYIIDFIKAYELVFQLMGAVVLFILGSHIFFTNPSNALKSYRRSKTNYMQDMFSTFIITVTNPLVIFVFLAIFAGYELVFDINEWESAAMLVGGIFLGACTWWFCLTYIVSLFRHKLNIRTLWWFNKLAGLGVMLFVIFTLIYFAFGGNAGI